MSTEIAEALPARSPGVRIERVTAGYRGFRRRLVLDGLDLVARPGQVTAVVGPNGVGKTTLFRTLLGFLLPWSGRVEVEGVAPRAFRLAHGVAYLPEAVALPAGYTLSGLLAEGARLAGLRGEEAARAVRAAEGEAALGEATGRRLTTLSKGMGRRAALAYALLGSPRLLLLDEPLSGLDPRSRHALREMVAAAAARGATVVLASHDLDEVKRLASVAYVLDRGRAVARLEGRALAESDLDRLVREAEGLP